VDLNAIVRGEGVSVHHFDLGNDVRELTFRDSIAINRREKNEAWIRYLVAHGLGHRELHAGSQLSFWRCLPQGDLAIRKQEAQADAFARYLLIPGEAYEEIARFRTSAEIAKVLQVPVHVIKAYEADIARYAAGEV
jgi:Zn-dependent peptidase ImmA (M78 family)